MKLINLLIILIPALSQAQIDSSLVIRLKASKENFDKALSLNEATAEQVDSITYLSINYSYLNKDSCLELGKKSVSLGEKLINRSVYANALLELGDTYRIYGNHDDALEALNEGLKIYESQNDTSQIAYAHNKLGAFFSGKGENQKAIDHYLLALKSWELKKDTANIFKPNLNIGLIFYRLTQLDKAQEYNDRAYELADAIDDVRQLGMAINNRGIYLKAIADEYKLKADSFPEKAKIYMDTVAQYHNRILENHQQALDIARKLNDQAAIMRSLVNIAIIKDAQGQYKEAIKLSRQANTIADRVGDVDLNLSNKNLLSKALRNDGQTYASIKMGEEALKLAKSKNMAPFIAGANNELHLSYKLAGQYDKAILCLEEINDYIRKTNEANTTKLIADAEAQYQNIKKENEILDQKNEILELAQKNTRFKKQRNSILGGSLFILLAGFFTRRLNKIKKERNDKRAFAEALIYAQEEERKRIARDLHDGIGQTLLLIKKQMASTQTVSLENQNLINSTLDEVRSISRDLHPFQLEKFGLKASIEELVEKISSHTDLFITKDLELPGSSLGTKKDLNIYRVIQEALNNIIKHSNATACKVKCHIENNNLNCSILDNGKGFDHEITVAKTRSLGLKTMNERIVNSGGKLTIKANKPSGTVVSFSIPILPAS